MYNSSPSFSIIVTCHNEQNYLINSLASVRNNIDFHLASFSDVNYEILLILDSPDVLTKSIAENWVKENEFGRIVLTNNRDIGMSRNLGIKNAQFDLIFLHFLQHHFEQMQELKPIHHLQRLLDLTTK